MFNSNDQLIVRSLYKKDVPDISSCLSSIALTMCKELFVAPSLDYIIAIISGYGHTVGAFLGSSLVGLASFVYPGTNNNNLGCFLNYDIEELLSVNQLEHIYVNPQYRRMGIAKKMIEYLLSSKEAIDNSILLSTVSPYNTPSLALAFKMGQRVVLQRNIYGVNRFLMCKNVKTNDCDSGTDLIEVPRVNTNKISELLSEGYEGVGFGDANATLYFRLNL